MLNGQLAELQTDEGLRLTVYDDASGLPLKPGMTLEGHATIGFGRALDVHGISEAEATALLRADVAATETALALAYPWWPALDPVRQGALINLAFNVGLGGFGRFRLMIAALADGDFVTAAGELQDSLWCRQVQRARSARLIAQLSTGVGPATPGDAMTSTSASPVPAALSVSLALDAATTALLSRLIDSVQTLKLEVSNMSGTTTSLDQALAGLQAQVAAETNATQAAVMAFSGFSVRLQQAVQHALQSGATPQQLQAVLDATNALQTNAQSLSQAVTANTAAAGNGGATSPAGGAAAPAGGADTVAAAAGPAPGA